MGENEQGGMLRTVIVLGLVALIAAVVTLSVVGLTQNASKQRDASVDMISDAVNANVGWQDDYKTSKFRYDAASFDDNAHTVSISGYKTGNNSKSSLVIPSTLLKDGIVYKITEIDNAAFISNKLTSIVIPDSVVSVGSGAFMGNDLTSVTFSKSMSNIESTSFAQNDFVTVTIPANIQRINGSAFMSNLSLQQVVIENHDASIDKAAFWGNDKIKFIYK